MSSKETVLSQYPEAVAECVQPEAHAAETSGRHLHWAVYAGPDEDARRLGVSMNEDSAWCVAADALS